MYVITGGAGFLGSALLWQLNGMGVDDIVIVDNLGESEKWRNLVNGRYADYLHRDRFLEMLKDNTLPFHIDGLAHLGACSSTTEKNADFLMENNFHYSQEVCRHVLEQGGRFINASSAATYGRGEFGYRDDPGLMPKLKPLNMYGYSKHLFDLWLLRQGLLDSVASLKFFNVFGPNEYHKGAMASVACKLHTEIREQGTATLFASNNPQYGDGEQMRDFVYVKDCSALMAWLLLEAPHVNGVRNVGSGTARTFNDVAGAVFSSMGKEPRIKYIPMPEQIAKQYQNYTCADMAWLEKVGYGKKFHTLEEGIGDYVGNYLEGEELWLHG